MAFKHFPLTSIHDHAMEASEAAEAAHAQGKFWEYHDTLFLNQDDLSREALERYAQEVGLDLKKFKEALDKHIYRARIMRDVREGQRLGVNGTPTIFLNGHRYTSPRGCPPQDCVEAIARKYLGLTD